MKRISLLLLLLCVAPALWAARTTLGGTAKGQEGRTIRLVCFTDQLSYQKKTLASARVADDGTFSLGADVDFTAYALLEIDFRQAEIFLVPGAAYQVTVVPFGEVSGEAYYDRTLLTIRITAQDSGRLNENIGNINELYNDFLMQNATLLQSSSRGPKVQELIRQMESRAGTGSDAYLQDYVRYKSASIELFMKTKSREKLAALYLTHQPVLYSQVEYMDFFHLFFEKYLVTNNAYMPYSRTSSLVNGTAGYREILGEMMKDPVLDDARLAEMVLMAGLKEMSGMSGFKLPRILELLAELGQVSPYPEHRVIAASLIARITWMKPGTAAPDFDLPGLTGGNHRLADYHGKYLYLSFIDLQSPSSLSEMNLMAGLYTKYRDRVRFVSIVARGLSLGWSQQIRDYGMEWDVLNGTDEVELVEAYGAGALPVFILIDPQGKIYRYPAPRPSENPTILFDAF